MSSLLDLRALVKPVLFSFDKEVRGNGLAGLLS